MVTEKGREVGRERERERQGKKEMRKMFKIEAIIFIHSFFHFPTFDFN